MTQEYFEEFKINNLPRLPLGGGIDLTHRCNNNCRHCWLRIPENSPEKENELTFEEIKRIVNEAKKMGCRSWAITGGEPMLRPDFAEIFDYITAQSIFYTINTNGTLITPKIARLMKRKGNKAVALYGATSKIHDQITRNPGSFEATMRGFRYLKEAGARFVVQIIPLRDNYRQFPEILKLATSLSGQCRIKAPWLYLSACGDRKINREIKRQRLDPKNAVDPDKPDLSCEEGVENDAGCGYCHAGEEKHFFSSCITSRKEFHIDPYGKTTPCSIMKNPEFCYDLKKGNFKECWDKFIPSLARKVKTTKEYKDNCGSCELRKDCPSCPAFAYLEKGRFGAKVDYLCNAAKENRKFKENWRKEHCRHFKIADIVIQVESDLPIRKNTFLPKFKYFEAKGPSRDMVILKHHFSLPNIEGKDLGTEVYRKAPWAVYKKEASWVYLGISPVKHDKELHRVAVFNPDHTRARIYNHREKGFMEGGLHSLTLFPTDQVLLARILADRQGCYLHSCGVIFNGKGLLFAGHSEAGKSTMAKMLKGKAEILCDDRIIIRKPENENRKAGNQYKIYGTWSHGEVPDVSANSAPLTAILFLRKAKENRIVVLKDKKEISKRLLDCIIKPVVTADWWGKTLSLIENISDVVPCYELYFDKSGKAVELLRKSFR